MNRMIDKPAKRAATATPCRVTVCRGCCCGDAAKIPGVDHAGQIPKLRAALDGAAPVRASECLDVCDQANVVVVQPSPAGRAAGGRPVWLGLVNDDEALADIAAWIRAGGPGLAEPRACSTCTRSRCRGGYGRDWRAEAPRPGRAPARPCRAPVRPGPVRPPVVTSEGHRPRLPDSYDSGPGRPPPRVLVLAGTMTSLPGMAR